jgi:putative endonuclease
MVGVAQWLEHQVVDLTVAGSSPVAHPSTSSGFTTPNRMNWNTYILLCDQKTYYIGLTSNLENRIKSHKRKENTATKEFSDIRLVYQEKYETRKEAENREKQLKGWSIAKKKALISGNMQMLIDLSKPRACRAVNG